MSPIARPERSETTSPQARPSDAEATLATQGVADAGETSVDVGQWPKAKLKLDADVEIHSEGDQFLFLNRRTLSWAKVSARGRGSLAKQTASQSVRSAAKRHNAAGEPTWSASSLTNW